jgi:translation initiation factor IF-3
VRVIDENGEQLGVMPLGEAVKRAQDQGLDLVAVSLQANPPVTKIVEFAKFLYDQKQREKRAKQNTKEVEVKELRFGPNIGEHDLDIRAHRAKQFLEDGDKVKINVQFRGRMITHQEVGRTKVERLLAELEEVADIERGPYQEGRSLLVLLQPKRNKKAHEAHQ